MKRFRYCYYVIGFLSACICWACTKMDDNYAGFLKDGEKRYPGVPDAVTAYSGKNRVKLSWLSSADPDVIKAVIYWNNASDSMVLPIQSTGEKTRMEIMLENLEENTYSFVIYTYDKLGNRSVPITVTGASYGQLYESTLLNRVVTAEMVNGDVVLTWATADAQVDHSELQYTDNSGTERTVLIPPAEIRTVLEDYKSGAVFNYRTWFKPDTTAIDFFASAFLQKGVKEDVTKTFLKNPGYPYLRVDDGTTRFGILADWIVNDAVKNQEGSTRGGFDSYGGASMALQHWADGEPEIINGKIYQTIHLPAGKYLFEIDLSGGYQIYDPAYLVVAAGNSLPDVADVATAIGSADFTSAQLLFELPQEQTVSIGILASLTQFSQYFRSPGVKLTKLE